MGLLLGLLATATSQSHTAASLAPQPAAVTDGCLTPQQKDNVEALVKAIHNSLSDTSSLLQTLAKNAKSDLVRDGLLAVARGIDAANNDFVSQIEKVLDE